MLTWPHDATEWASNLLATETVFIRLARKICHFQRLLIVCRDADHRRKIQHRLAAAGVDPRRVIYALAPSNDSWARDHGPLTVLDDNQPLLLDFRFNAWGSKYPFALDDRINGELFRQGVFAVDNYRSVDLVLEGGAIETDGQNTLLATTGSVLSVSRNPTRDRADIEHELRELLGIQRFLWLELDRGLQGDDTDGHVDTLARFCSPTSICYQAPGRPKDADYPLLSSLENQLRSLRTPKNDPYQLIPLPPVTPYYAPDGRRLPATYANFLIINGAVLVPVYGAPEDAEATRCLERCFPKRAVIAVDSRPLIRQAGSLHCVTMQFPAAVRFSA